MPVRKPGWFSETWRVLAYTLAVALAFLAIQRLQMAAITAPSTQDLLARAGWLGADADSKLLPQAAQVAADSQAALQRLPPGHRQQVLRMGYEIGFVSQWVGGFALSTPEVQAQARSAAAPHWASAQQQAGLLGISAPEPLPSRSLREFVELDQRFESDEDGGAQRVQQALSPLHRHLYLLGVHLGKESARVESSGGEQSAPPAGLIRRHATLAGVPPALWKPLAAQSAGESPAQVLARYRAGMAALEAGLAAGGHADGGPGSK
jgi:hypothetical protein